MMGSRHPPPCVVAIDGPAASGKSSTAAEVARRLGYLHVDSGALYRAVTCVALDLGGAGAGGGAIIRAADARGVDLVVRDATVKALIDGRAIGDRLRGADVTAEVSPVSALPEVRDWVNRRLRGLAATGRPSVVEGRDIGTAVFPDAPVKVFLTASPAVRAARRLQQRGETADQAAMAAEAARIAARDQADASREVAPLRAAEDAVQLDTSALGFEEQVDRIVRLVLASPLPRSGSGD